jgi:hypothetical protein
MNLPIDSLFKSKLEHYATPAPTRAWARVESGLNKSFHAKFWLKIAAGIAMLGTASVLVINLMPADEQPLAQQAAEPNTPKINISSPRPHETFSPATSSDTELKRVPPMGKSIPQPIAKTEEPVQHEDPVELPTAVAAVTDAVVMQPATGLVIVLSAEEVNSKYLLPVTEPEATVEHKKSSRLQKLASVAHNFSNEDIVGDLREKKNELFAFNFLNDKKERKN